MILVCLLLVFPVVGGFSATIYTEDFNVATGSSVPTTLNETWFHNWTVSEADTWWWPTGVVHTTYGSGTKWINRNLRDGVIASNEAVENPTVSADMWMTWGGNADGLKLYVALLGADGNGYIGETTRDSRLAIYRVDNGVMGTWTELAGNAAGVGGNSRTMTFSVNNGALTLVNNLGGSVSVSGETTYTGFSQIAFSGYFTAGECVLLDNVNVAGTVVPEPTVMALLAMGLIGSLLRRKK
jgi:hypothetical protein